MGITKTADGRYQVGKGIDDANNYTGALGKRDMVIQYTEDGVTEQSMEYLTFLKDYAEHHAELGELIKPSDVSIWIAKDDKLTAVEADDISYSDGTFTLSSITYNGTDWTFGEPTPGGGSGGGVPTPTSEDVGKVLTAISGLKTATLVPEQTLTNVPANTPVSLSSSTFDGIDVGDTVHVTITASIGHDSFDGDVEVTNQGIVVTGRADIYTIYDSGTDIYFSSDYSLTSVTIEVTAEVAGEPTASWQTASGGGVIVIPDEVVTKITTAMQNALPSAISAGIGVPSCLNINFFNATDQDARTAFIDSLRKVRDTQTMPLIQVFENSYSCPIYVNCPPSGETWGGFEIRTVYNYLTYKFDLTIDVWVEDKNGTPVLHGYNGFVVATLVYVGGGNS